MERADQELWRAKEVSRLLSLVEAERRYYQEILTNLPVPVATLDKELQLSSANRAFRRLFSLPVDLQQTPPLPQLTGIERLAEVAEQVWSSGLPHAAMVSAVATASGSLPVRYTLQPMRDWDLQAEPELVLLAEVELEQQPAPLLGKPYPGISWELDPVAMRFLEVNEAAVETLQLPAEHWKQGADFLSARVMEADLASVRAFYETAIAGGPVGAFEYRGAGADGRTRWLRDQVLLVHGEPDPVLRLHGITVDVTESRRQDEFLMHAARLDALSRVAGRVVHDCNNLLMILGGYGEELLHGLASDDPLRSNVQEILAAGDRLSALASQLAVLAPTQAATQQPRLLALDAFLASLGAEIRTTLPSSVQLELDLQAPEMSIQADAKVLASVLKTLCSRRVESLRKGGQISLRSRAGVIASSKAGLDAVPPAGAAVSIHVADTGMAIHPNELAVVFEPSLEGDKPRQNLTAVFQEIRDMGGMISVESSYGSGTCFTVTFPARAGAAQEPMEPRHTVLLVDDEMGIRSLIRKVLSRRGYRVLEASSGEEALDTARETEHPLDLLISDVVMPRMNGVDLAGSIRELWPDLPVLFISGYTGAAELDPENLPARCAFLSKPFGIAALQKKVEELLDEAAASAGA